MTPPTDPPRPSPAAEAAEKYVEDEIASGRRCCTECGRKAEDRQAHVHKAWRAGASWRESQPCRCNNCIGPSWQLAQSAEKPPELPLWECSKCKHLQRASGPSLCKGYCYDASGKSCNGLACPKCSEKHWWTGGVSQDADRAPAASQSASPPAPQQVPAVGENQQPQASGSLCTKRGQVVSSSGPLSPSSSEASFAERAAQLWCLPQHSHKEMDADLAISIAALAQSVRDETEAKYAPLVETLEQIQRDAELGAQTGVVDASAIVFDCGRALRSLRAAVSPSGREADK